MDEQTTIEQKIIEALRTIVDTEIPVTIYDLGLVYQSDVDENKMVHIVMTLTTPNCPVAESLPEEVMEKLQKIEGVSAVEVNLTFDPPWSQDNLSEEARLELGLI